jgi:hypothetical protein
MSYPTINTKGAQALLDEAREILVELEGTRPNIEVSTKEINSAKAEAQRKLLYAAHLADAARLDIMSLYHRFKGQIPPRVSR